IGPGDAEGRWHGAALQGLHDQPRPSVASSLAQHGSYLEARTHDPAGTLHPSRPRPAPGTVDAVPPLWGDEAGTAAPSAQKKTVESARPPRRTETRPGPMMQLFVT